MENCGCSWSKRVRGGHDGKWGGERWTSGSCFSSVVLKKLIAAMSNETNATDDFLDYDINDSLSHFDWAELGPVLVVYSLTFFLGLIGERKYFASFLHHISSSSSSSSS